MAFDPVTLAIEFLIILLIDVAVFLLMPKPKGPKPDATTDLESPTAEAGRPEPIPFGTVTIKSPNVLWFGEKSTIRIKVKV